MYHERYYGDKTVPDPKPASQVFGFDCKIMTDAQLEEYLRRTRNLYVDLTRKTA